MTWRMRTVSVALLVMLHCLSFMRRFSVFNKSQVVCNTIDVEETFNAEIFSFTIVMHNDNQMC